MRNLQADFLSVKLFLNSTLLSGLAFRTVKGAAASLADASNLVAADHAREACPIINLQTLFIEAWCVLGLAEIKQAIAPGASGIT